MGPRFYGWIAWDNGVPRLTVKESGSGRVVFADMGLPADDAHGDYLCWAEWNGYDPVDPADFLEQIEWIVESNFEGSE